MGKTKKWLVAIPMVIILILVSYGSAAAMIIPDGGGTPPDQPIQAYTWSYQWLYTDPWVPSHFAAVSKGAGYYELVWLPNTQKWLWDFRTNFAMEARNINPPVWFSCEIRSHGMKLEETYNQNYIAIFTTNDPQYTGAWPYDGTSVNYAQVATILFTAVISALNQYAAFPVTAYQLVNYYLECSKNSAQRTVVTRDWIFPAWQWGLPVLRNAAHWTKFYVEQSPNKMVRFRITDYLNFFHEWKDIGGIGTKIDKLQMATEFTLPAMAPPSAMSASKMQEYGITAIPLRDADKACKEHGISPEAIMRAKKEASKTGDSVIYVCSNPPLVTAEMEIIGDPEDTL